MGGQSQRFLTPDDSISLLVIVALPFSAER